jgi:iron complex transport system ATP-binding protein
MSFFTVTNLTAGYDKSHIIEDISFEIERGCLMGILGANGSGKTTLLKAICGILPHQGTCTLEQTVLEKLSPRQIAKLLSYIPQRSGITIDISVLDVVLMGFNPQLGLLEHPSKKMKEAALAVLARVGLEGKEETNYLHLSEGQKQLCILARTLVSPGKLLLLDEPESALDFRFRHQMLSLLRGWVAAGEGSAIVTLHDPGLALNFCDKLLLLGDRGVLGILEPQRESLDKMEQMLRQVYGNMSLQRCQNRRGESQIVILREGEV